MPRKSGKAKQYTKKDVKALLRAVQVSIDWIDGNISARAFLDKYPHINSDGYISQQICDEVRKALLPFREVSR